MKIYLDLCSLKRPFDDQSENRIWIETQAVIRIVQLFDLHELELASSHALVLENNRNPNEVRRARTAALLARFGRPAAITRRVVARAAEVRSLGFQDMDALHIAFAESERCGYLVTCDDKIMSTFSRNVGKVRVKVITPVDFLEDFER